ncbi:MAG: glycosyl hydrolase family 8 [Pseudomonadota bacterium]
MAVLLIWAGAAACAQAPAGAPGSSGGSGGAPAGTGGASIPTGSGGAPGAATVMNPPSAYPHNSAGAKYPFPQGHALARCSFPAYNTDSVATAYNNWKTKFFQGGRVVRLESNNDTVSEGIAYGMLIGVYVNDKPMFDALWTYAQSKRNGNGLMNWHIDSSGNTINPGGGATDADEDMAWALLMAGTQWGGSYTASATTLINAIWDHEIDQGGGNVLKPGDNFGGANQTNPSYFAPSYYRAFAKATPNHNWMAVVDSSYSILAKASGSLGLVPNWTNAQGAAVNGPNNDPTDPHYGYDACRTPWRIALDYCENGEPRAKAYLDLITAFYAGASSLKDGYTVSGGNPPGTLGDYAAGMAFFGPGGVAAMSGGHDAFLKIAYGAVQNASTAPGTMGIAGVFTYYHASWGVLSLLAMSGNFWNMVP